MQFGCGGHDEVNRPGVIADVDAGMLAQLLELRARQVGLAALRTAVEDPDSSESAAWEATALGRALWL
ncbi:hypothetical protein ACFYWD_33645 [Streptomyces sp. NPDC003781]|uniref:hypothetical protein n=1 Tax=Streptomyces sp. NPDC003781 TaxID=3364686 RepID=UPI0036810DAD